MRIFHFQAEKCELGMRLLTEKEAAAARRWLDIWQMLLSGLKFQSTIPTHTARVEPFCSAWYPQSKPLLYLQCPHWNKMQFHCFLKCFWGRLPLPPLRCHNNRSSYLNVVRIFHFQAEKCELGTSLLTEREAAKARRWLDIWQTFLSRLKFQSTIPT